MRNYVQRAFAIVVIMVWNWPIALAVPITVTQTYQFLDNVSPNSIRLVPGLRQQFGSTCVVPVGTPCNPQAAGAPFGTTGSASQAGTTINLNFQAADLASNHFSRALPAGTLPTGSWTLNFNNGPDTATGTTPALASVAPIGFAQAISQSGGTSPTFSWTVPTAPAGQSIDAVVVIIRDLSDFRGVGGVGGNGIATLIYRAPLSPSTTSLTVAPNDTRFLGGNTALVPGRPYSLEIQVQDTRNNLSGGGFPNVATQSRLVLDFRLLPAGAPAQVYLPMIDTSGPVPIHRFQPIPVVAGQLIFIDPLIAVGYDYQIGLGNPNFRSVLLPGGVGDNLFDLWLWNGANWTDTGTDLFGGVEFLFTSLVGSGGLDRFRITGIEPDEFLDPFSATAFITGVSFVADGFFDGTMTPLVVEIAQAPEPASLALLGIALAGLALARRRKKT